MKKILCLILSVLCLMPHITMAMEVPNVAELPDDVIKTIAENCGACDRVALRQTCERFRTLIAGNHKQDLLVVRTPKMIEFAGAMADFFRYKRNAFCMSGPVYLFWVFFYLGSVITKLPFLHFMHWQCHGIMPIIIGEVLISTICLLSTLKFKFDHPSQTFDHNLDAQMAMPAINDPAFIRAWDRFNGTERADSKFFNGDTFGDKALLMIDAFRAAMFELMARVILVIKL